MKIGVTERDKILLSAKQASEVGYAGACTSSDPTSCWVTFGSGVSRTGAANEGHKGNICFVKSSILPDGSLSCPPEFIRVTAKDAAPPSKPEILLPVLDSANCHRITIGGFPGGDVASFELHFAHGPTAEFIDQDQRPDNCQQREIDVSLSATLNVYRRKFLKALARR